MSTLGGCSHQYTEHIKCIHLPLLLSAMLSLHIVSKLVWVFQLELPGPKHSGWLTGLPLQEAHFVFLLVFGLDTAGRHSGGTNECARTITLLLALS